MDRRQFLIAAGKAGLFAAAATALDACGTPAPTSALRSADASARPLGSTPAGIGPASASGSVSPPIGSRTDTHIAAENRRPGDRGWDLDGLPESSSTWVFAEAASVAAGDTLRLHVASHAPVNVAIYRFGWYGGAGGRRVHETGPVPVAAAGPTAIDHDTGLAEPTGGAVVPIPVGPDWPSGLYAAVVHPMPRPVTRSEHSRGRSGPRGAGGPPDLRSVPAMTPFSVRGPGLGLTSPGGIGRAPVLFVSAAATWQAYNVWGGADLYSASQSNAPRVTAGRRAVQVSFDRPHALHHGAGLMPRWELDFVRWQEREGRDVDYCADVDLELHPEVVQGRRLILFVGHHEYWSRPMRATIELAIASGTNVAFLSADEMAWQIRLDASPLGTGRRLTCYKSARLDPMATTKPELTTCHWRDPPVNDPEATTIGQMYGHIVSRVADWVVADSGHWLYESTGLRDGDRIRNLVGQEFDTFYPDLAPPGTAILARSPVVPQIRSPAPTPAASLAPLAPNLQTATAYVAESGATVLAAGTFQWAWALDSFGDRSYLGTVTPLDERVARMTRNLFNRLGDGSAAT
ncbi:MAG TPA: N,N-dimethylformamidase beta subunit family domain-containing protein [Candidatus Limnocylindrales bacterium]|nr:N,N-dimethylformamidase beta subunit family domain-containing protein [Candidatus Limnocylindrales bacterium]